ncbi:hypothetical protein FRC14_001111 [Serendipita sp. 396]|nr:hypothetical protein FRC14_001111 [Serendipita sp. 396]KAG8773932.1 hypothetical protein FRC15_001683 [Serendipita sp. 397]KAG8851542.1 hypothetical protein FRC20_001736 [Serendipita sp. 405]
MPSISYNVHQTINNLAPPSGPVVPLRMALCVYVIFGSRLFILPGALVTGVMIGRRTKHEPHPNRPKWLSRRITGAHCATALLYVCCGSLAFTTLLLFGTTASLSQAICSLSATGPFIFIGISKCLSIFAILVQVHRHFSQNWNRWYYPSYVLGLIDALLIIGTTTVAILNRHSSIEDDDQCRLRLQPEYIVAILVSDTLVTALFFALLLLPAFRDYGTSEFMLVARRGSAAALLSFVVYILNYGALLLLGGTELAWIWLISCSASVFLLTMVAMWVTKQNSHFSELSVVEQPLAHVPTGQPTLEHQRSRRSLSVSPTLPEWARPVESTLSIRQLPLGGPSHSRRVSDDFLPPDMRSPALLTPIGILSSSIHAKEMVDSPPIDSKDDMPKTKPVLGHESLVSSSNNPSSLFHPYYVKPLPPPPLTQLSRIYHVSNNTMISTMGNENAKRDTKVREYHYLRRRMALSGNDSSILPLSLSSSVSNRILPDSGGIISKQPTGDRLVVTSQVEDQLYSHHQPNQSILLPSEILARIRSRSEETRADVNRHIRLDDDIVGRSSEGRSDTPTYIVYGTALGSPSQDAKDALDTSSH